jgi:hypothetical protein
MKLTKVFDEPGKYYHVRVVYKIDIRDIFNIPVSLKDDVITVG